MLNPRPPEHSAAAVPSEYFTASDGMRLEVFHFSPAAEVGVDVFIAPGITGMNCATDFDLIEVLSSVRARVTAIFPRGTGHSEGVRGDVDLSRFIDDFVEGVKHSTRGQPSGRSVFIYGHSMSCAVALMAARRLDRVDGIILVNPPVKRKEAKGMTPSFGEYLRYAGYFVLAPKVPIVNMAGDPQIMLDPLEREEARARNADPLLVKYFSMRVMMAVGKALAGLPEHARALTCPLLLIHGSHDSVVDEAGCRELFDAWKGTEKTYLEVAGGPHGKQTVLLARNDLSLWIKLRSKP